MTTQAWPFLISRNKYIDYRTVVAPDFMCGAKLYNLLARAAEGELSHKGHAYIRNIAGSLQGDFTIIYRVVNATDGDLDRGHGEGVLTDQFGREIYIYEGILIRGLVDRIRLSSDCFRRIHMDMLSDYQAFWSLVEPVRPVASHSFSLEEKNASDVATLKRLDPVQLASAYAAPLSSSTERKQQFVDAVNIKAKGILLVLLLGLCLATLWGRNMIFGKSISLGCAMTWETEHELDDNIKISSMLELLQKNYGRATDVYLTGELIIQPNDRIKNMPAKNVENKRPTIQLVNNLLLKMTHHPLGLALADTRSLRSDGKSKVKLLVIDQNQCEAD